MNEDTVKKEQETLKKEIEKLRTEYEDKCILTKMTEYQVNDILKERMSLIKQCNERQDITYTLFSKYASIKNCTLRAALEEFDVPADL
ncbi:hypothetical protein BC941DRAFT_515297 [Chlamydoabsidia padenii]|nr:hypothetical protein BC941DRAFT_515297 [Chlamydoabsidia padenii]